MLLSVTELFLTVYFELYSIHVSSRYCDCAVIEALSKGATECCSTRARGFGARNSREVKKLYVLYATKTGKV